MLRFSFALVFALLLFGALSLRTASAQASNDLLISPGDGAAGSRFQVVGQSGWTPGETVTLDFAFSDLQPGAGFGGQFYHVEQVTVLRDGSWSFPVVVNSALFPFPLWRPGFIVVRASNGTRTELDSFVYTVQGRAPLGTPPLAELGVGPSGAGQTLWTTLALFGAAVGVLVAAAGALRARIA